MGDTKETTESTQKMQAEPQWVKASVEVDEASVETASALLWAQGASGVEVQDNTTLTEHRAPLAAGRARAVAFIGGVSTEELLERLKSATDVWGLGDAVIGAEIFTDQSWKDNWKQFFKPLHVSGRLGVRPPWEEHDFGPGVETIIIEPGLAFGTGSHATTQLCLRQIDELLAQETPASMIDVGCGSGILSIGAALLAPEMAIAAMDVDPEATRVSAENFQDNNVSDRIELLGPALSEIPGPYELVVANILSHILIMLGEDLVRCTAPKGRLLLSGIGESSVEEVRAHFSGLGMELANEAHENGWAALTWRFPA